MLDGLLLGIFGNAIYEFIRNALSSNSTNVDDDIVYGIYDSLEKTTDKYFDKYGNEFGDIYSCFLARQKNIDVIVRHMFYDDNNDLILELCNEGFDGAKPASKEALSYFVSNLNAVMMEDFRLNKIIIEKKHIAETRQILDKLERLLQSKEQVSGKSKTEKNGWIFTDDKGNTSEVVEGKQNRFMLPCGVEYKIMVKEDTRYIEMTDEKGQISYYEIDDEGNATDLKLPYDISEFTLIYPKDQLINKSTHMLLNGFRKEIIKLKWNKMAIVVYDNHGKLSDADLRGGWKLNYNNKVIEPRD